MNAGQCDAGYLQLPESVVLYRIVLLYLASANAKAYDSRGLFMHASGWNAAVILHNIIDGF
jgi:hypothetical protein